MQTIEQFASERMGAEPSAPPTLRLAATSSHMKAIEISEISKPGRLVLGLCPVHRL